MGNQEDGLSVNLFGGTVLGIDQWGEGPFLVGWDPGVVVSLDHRDIYRLYA